MKKYIKVETHPNAFWHSRERQFETTAVDSTSDWLGCADAILIYFLFNGLDILHIFHGLLFTVKWSYKSLNFNKVTCDPHVHRTTSRHAHNRYVWVKKHLAWNVDESLLLCWWVRLKVCCEDGQSCLQLNGIVFVLLMKTYIIKDLK